MRAGVLVILIWACAGAALVIDEAFEGPAMPPGVPPEDKATAITSTSEGKQAPPTAVLVEEATTAMDAGEPTPTIKNTPTPAATPVIQKQPPSPQPRPSPEPTPAKPMQPPMPVPTLPPSYEVTIEVIDVLNNESFEVQEKERDGRAKHILAASTLNVTCILNTLTAEGYLVEGVRCGRYSGLPQKCFCTSLFCRPYVALGALLQYLRSSNASHAQVGIGGAGNVEVLKWQVTSADMTVEAVYTRSSVGQLSPLVFTVKGTGRVFMLPGGPLSLQYKVKSWALTTEPAYMLVSTPPGVFCPAHDRKFIPKLANQFSLTMETVIENLGTIAYEQQNYESEEKLVSFTYRPHLHADGMFFLNIRGLNDITIETYRVIHDFKTGIQYMINEKTSNCSIQGIPLTALDAVPAENQHIRLRHASELISIDPNMFIYKGTRRVRGILCDVWVAERGLRKGQYSTVEIYFSHENWTVEVEVFNKVHQVPIGISSYVAVADNPSHWASVVHTFFYQYSDGHPSWRHFDISPCLNRINRIFLILSLEVSYSELVHYNLEAAKNSIRRAVAGIAGVSPLRITDLFLSSRQATGEVDVWFVLLEKPDVTGPVLTPRPQLMMADAYKLLHDITHKHNVSVKLDLSPKKKLFVTIKRGSLETTTEALHPHMRHRSLRYLKAGYTAGSMAGLGFSMAILGTCMGIFVGFLLWKRHTSVPYQVTE